jgi:hypothetical protein
MSGDYNVVFATESRYFHLRGVTGDRPVALVSWINQVILLPEGDHHMIVRAGPPYDDELLPGVEEGPGRDRHITFVEHEVQKTFQLPLYIFFCGEYQDRVDIYVWRTEEEWKILEQIVQQRVYHCLSISGNLLEDALSPDTSSDRLAVLAECPLEIVLQAVGHNPNIDYPTLKYLFDIDPAYVAGNPAIELFKLSDPGVAHDLIPRPRFSP